MATTRVMPRLVKVVSNMTMQAPVTGPETYYGEAFQLAPYDRATLTVVLKYLWAITPGYGAVTCAAQVSNDGENWLYAVPNTSVGWPAPAIAQTTPVSIYGEYIRFVMSLNAGSSSLVGAGFDVEVLLEKS